jgi:uncharacterized protein YkwD
MSQSIEQEDEFVVDEPAPNAEGSDSEGADAAVVEPELYPKSAQAIIELTNEYRQARGLEPVQADEHLNEASRYFAKYMARRQKYGHQADDHTPAERATDHGYDYCIVLENIAYRDAPGEFDPHAAAKRFMKGWRDSPEHRKNLRDPDVTQMGAALAVDGEGACYAVQMFGRPRAQRIELRLVNSSSETVHYAISGRGFERSYELEPNTARLHRVCRPPNLKLMRDESDRMRQNLPGGELTFRTDQDEKLVIERTGGGP